MAARESAAAGGINDDSIGTISITSANVIATGGGYSAGIGGGVFNTGGSITINTDADDNPCIVFASGDTDNDSNDIGKGYQGSSPSVTIGDGAQVFLRHDSITTPTLNGQTSLHVA